MNTPIRTATRLVALAASLFLMLAACGKSPPPADPLKGAHETIEKAKRLEGIVGGAAEAERKKIDDDQTK